jgi:hypothetical protein
MTNDRFETSMQLPEGGIVSTLSPTACLLKKLCVFALSVAALALFAQSTPAQTVTVTPLNLSFGIPTGTSPATSAAENATLNITGTGTVSFPTLATVGTASYAITGNSCQGTLTAPATCAVSVAFSSTSTTILSDTLTIPYSVGGLAQTPFTVGLTGAYGAIKLASSIVVQPSTTGSFTNLYAISTSPLNLSCPSSPTATLSNTPGLIPGAGLGNVLVDNYITLAINGAPVTTYVDGNSVSYSSGTTVAYPFGNICMGSDASPDSSGGNTYPECFTNAYRNDAASLGSLAQTSQAVDSDSITNANSILSGPGGVAALNIGTFFGGGGSIQATITAVDAGGEMASSSLFLVSNCSIAGIVPGGTVTGNPVNPNNPTTLTQTAVFDSAPNQNISLTTSTAAAPNAVPAGTVQQTTDIAIPQQLFNQMVANTSAAPAVCFRIAGEIDGSGNAMCKAFLIQCSLNGSPYAGDNCVPNITAARDLFDEARFSSPDGPVNGTNYLYNGLNYPYTGAPPAFNACQGFLGGSGNCAVPNLTPGSTSLMGPGLLLGGDNWTNCVPSFTAANPCTLQYVNTSTLATTAVYSPANCAFSGSLTGYSCPLDILTAFLGAADGQPGGTTMGKNSIEVPVANMPLPYSSVSSNLQADSWTNSPSVNFGFTSYAANYNSTGDVPPSNGFTPAPVYSVTYGYAPASSPVPDTTYAVPGDVSIYNSSTQSIAAASTAKGGQICNVGGTTPLNSGSQNATITPTGDGIYVLHYFTTDCALTEELLFNPTASQLTNPTANWASFRTLTFGVDTVDPVLSCPLTPASPNGSNGWYISSVSETCTATDPAGLDGQPGSGFPPATGLQGVSSETLPTVTLTTSGTFPAVNVTDLANNPSNNVPAAPVHIDQVEPTIGCSFTGASGACSSNPTILYGATGVFINYSCADTLPGSGLASCAGQSAGTCPAAGASGPGTDKFSLPISTSSTGTVSATVYATDCAGNTSAGQPVEYTVAYGSASLLFGQFPLMVAIPGTIFQYLIGAADNNPASNPVPIYGANISATLTIPAGTLASGTATAMVSDVTCTSFPCSAVPPSGSSCTVTPSAVSSSTTSLTVNCSAGTINDLAAKKTGVVVKLSLPISKTAPVLKAITTSGTFTASSPLTGATTFKSSVPIL